MKRPLTELLALVDDFALGIVHLLWLGMLGKLTNPACLGGSVSYFGGGDGV